MEAKTNSKKGVASLPTVGVLGILILIIGIGISAAALTESFASLGALQASKALLYAEAGARDALIRIARNRNYVCETPPAGCYQIDFVSGGCGDNSGCARITVATGSPKTIISEGRAGSSVRKVRVEAVFDASFNGEIASVNWQEVTD